MMRTFSLVLTLCAALTACGDNGPTEVDIRKVLDDDYAAANKAVQETRGSVPRTNRPPARVFDLKLKACKKASEGWDCEVTADLQTPAGARERGDLMIRLVQHNGAWHVASR
jgi:predicted small lipoprotein YifL